MSLNLRYSCVIPTRDRGDMVQEAVASVLAQTLPAAEIIVVDDGSRDHTAATLRALYPGLHLLQLDGRGPGAARNAGVAAASTEIILFLDSDDLWLPDHAQRLLAALAGRYAVAYGPTRNLNLVDGGEFAIPAPGEAKTGDCFEALLRWCFLVPSAVAVQRRAFTDCGGFGMEFPGEDWAFFLKLAARHHFAYTGDPPVTLRRLHAGSLCRLAAPEQLAAALNRLAGLFAAGQDHHQLTALRRRQVRQRFAELAAWTESRSRQAQWSTIEAWQQDLRNNGMLD
ncbi:glycosyltransferase family 2 protein [Desulfurivibrio alkaliphilus]|uniref:Glycosyl transferase family 2 n=1 Tax=Desulfurivibrio alkaliphilus (strain DSM 19089 / UNIQEM U267 / AHT2) TaxID=589865 RepID=D6Z6S0_DESAT|nr:glycosyltransferase family 2 protein [Desulfurivibrio alkaliphilus]ADH85029.1 glycosyl transferase family 2 [Desulfurivibrio alkaliphilus AHT 2]